LQQGGTNQHSRGVGMGNKLTMIGVFSRQCSSKLRGYTHKKNNS